MLGLLLVTLVLTGSRSGVLGFLASMGYLVWNSRHRLILAMLGIVLAAGAFTLLPEQYKGRYNTMTQSKLDGSSSERINVWKKGLRMVVDRPLTGVGIHCFGTANALSYSSGPKASYLESHSLYVQIPAELGLIGAVAFFGYLAFAMRFNRRLRTALQEGEDPESWALERVVLRAMNAGFVALLITGVFGHSLMRITWYIYPAMALSVARVYLIRSGQSAAPAARQLLG
jgi:O-antigen ligase